MRVSAALAALSVVVAWCWTTTATITTVKSDETEKEKDKEKEGDNQQPNIVFFFTDDQDTILDGMQTMIQTKKLMGDEGMTFRNAFVSSPVCCVSRASFLTGRYTHNNGVFNNSYQGGCNNINTWNNGSEQYNFAAEILKNPLTNNYRTLYAGKYMNQYGKDCCGGISHIPLGWTDWFALQGNSQYYDYTVSDNGKALYFNDSYHKDYFTDNIKRRGLAFLEDIEAKQQSQNKNNKNQPFLMVLAVPAAHDPFEPAPQYNDTAEGEIAVRSPNWNMTGMKDKHELMREIPPMNETQMEQSDEIFRRRLGAMKSVDDMIADIFNKIELMGQLDHTWFFYTSDHGFHLGQFGMHFDKRQMYESDLRVPFLVRGPGVPKGQETDYLVTSIDLAPTFLDIITGEVPSMMDGLSMLPVLDHSDDNDNDAWLIKDDSGKSRNGAQTDFQFYVEYYGELNTAKYEGIQQCTTAIPGYYSAYCDQWNNTYQCTRSITKEQYNGTIYCVFQCFDNGKNQVNCPSDEPEGQAEYYDMDVDPWQLTNKFDQLNDEQRQLYQNQIENFGHCQGQSECNTLRFDANIASTKNQIQKKLHTQKLMSYQLLDD